MTTLLIAGVVLFVAGVIWVKVAFGNSGVDKDTEGWATFLLIIGGILLFAWGWLNADEKGNKNGYKQGQIDYHNRIIKYELKMNPDSTVVWEEIKTK